MALKLASESLPALSGLLSGKKYNMLGRIVTHWADIVGADMAAKTAPGKLKYQSKKGQKKPEFTLAIETSSADATVMSYRIDLILARINQIFGEGIITAIRFVPITANTSTPVMQKRKKPLSQEKKDYIQDAIEDVEDNELQERLKSLGTMILQDERSSS